MKINGNYYRIFSYIYYEVDCLLLHFAYCIQNFSLEIFFFIFWSMGKDSESGNFLEMCMYDIFFIVISNKFILVNINTINICKIWKKEEKIDWKRLTIN